MSKEKKKRFYTPDISGWKFHKDDNTEEFKPSLNTDTDCSITVVGNYDNFEALEAVFDQFNVFQTFIPDKDWTNFRIKAVRSIYDTVSMDYKQKLPENRP